MRQSDKKWILENVGILGKIGKFYEKFCNFIKFAGLSVTLFLIPVEIVFIIYYSFICFIPVRVIVYCVVLFVTLYTNIKL